jgi:hypothetical protein
LRVQSASPDGAPPQVFETSREVVCDWRLNALRIQAPPTTQVPFAKHALTVQVRIDAGPDALAALKPGQRLLIAEDHTKILEEKRIAAVEAVEERVRVHLDEHVDRAFKPDARAFTAARSFRLFGHAAPATVMTPKTVTVGTASRIDWTLSHLGAGEYAYPRKGSGLEPSAAVLCLDGAPGGLAVGGSLLVVDDTGVGWLVRIESVDEATDEFAGVAGSVTRVAVGAMKGLLPDTLGDRRLVVVHELLDELVPAHKFPAPSIALATVAVIGTRVDDELGAGVEVGRIATRDGLTPGFVLRPADLPEGRMVLVDDDALAPITGRIAATPTIVTVDPGGGAALLVVLDLDGHRTLQGASAQLFGNVLEATHGETIHGEVIGSGDASAPFQQFSLNKAPLTYVPSATASGKSSTLSLRINGVEWSETPVLYGQNPNAHVYETRTAPDGKTIAQVGDGDAGARAPSGTGNITARYRVGTGLAGRVGARTLTTLLDRLAGLKDVTNPQAATGGADPETLAEVRERAPRTVRTFGRAISLADHADLVTESGEIAKAQAIWVWSGYEQVLHLTVAGQAGGTFSDDGLRRIGRSLALARDANHSLLLANYVPVEIGVAAQVTVAADYERVRVRDAAEAALEAMLAFDAVDLGVPLHLSDVYRTLQEVAGVDHLLVTRFGFWKPASMTPAEFDQLLSAHGVTRDPGGAVEPVQARLRLLPARPDPAVEGAVLPAELAAPSAAAGAVQLSVAGGLEV